ncbi:outer membrane protein assembly factor BamC [Marinobacter sp. NP-4(2019)]|uniref:outer membrane protein assembly factor BamC n=1 Tax=Marinobacter sp. NP-4(2019) TaxID=2488665 RepID=UPI000FC3C95D|nr:outer membrane protein assembly factor BamC [Marinobacter sp. NP-4(2019)]AZT84144.1 outer membrane protein assembly factor BamC [Marinobacter sp. NP-4(2019)]
MAFLFRTEVKRVLGSVAPATGLMFVLAASGCSLLEDRSERYVNAQEGDELRLPETADESRFGQAMPIRDVITADSGRMYRSSIPEPPDMTSEILDENYVVEELDGQMWLLVNDVPGRVWPSVSSYMNERGLGVAHDSPQLGLLQSELVNFSKRARTLLDLESEPGSAEDMLVVQARVAPGVRRKTTEVQLRVHEVDGNPDELLAWQTGAEPTEEGLATSKRLLSDMGQFLRGREESKSYSRAALGMTAEPLVRLISENETPVAVEMDLDYGRAWSEVSRALDDAGVPVLDLNRSEGWFNVDFRSESERESGWFDWFGDDEKPKHTFDVRLQEQGDVLVVTASRASGYDGDDRSSELLSELFEYLY